MILPLHQPSYAQGGGDDGGGGSAAKETPEEENKKQKTLKGRLPAVDLSVGWLERWCVYNSSSSTIKPQDSHV